MIVIISCISVIVLLYLCQLLSCVNCCYILYLHLLLVNFLGSIIFIMILCQSSNQYSQLHVLSLVQLQQGPSLHRSEIETSALNLNHRTIKIYNSNSSKLIIYSFYMQFQCFSISFLNINVQINFHFVIFIPFDTSSIIVLT